MKRSSIIVIVIAGFVAMAALFGLLVVGWLHTFRGGQGFAVTPAEVKGDGLPPFFLEVLPPGARNIRYRWGARSPYVQAEFSLGESEFLDWASRQGWQVRPIKGVAFMNLSSFFCENGHEDEYDFEHGYAYENDNFKTLGSGKSVSVWYSTARQKVYLDIGYD